MLENGGNDPLLVNRDVDPAWAGVATGAFANSGQICVSVERIYVHQEIVDAFVDALVREADRDLAPLGTGGIATRCTPTLVMRSLRVSRPAPLVWYRTAPGRITRPQC